MSWPVSVAAADPGLQALAARTLGTRRGAIIVLDVASGRLLAVVHPQTAFTHAYPPGSVLKIATGYGLLTAGRLDPIEILTCRNTITIGGAARSCNVPGGHGRVGFVDALARSCSVYFYRQVQRLTWAEWAVAVRAFGAGVPPPAIYPRTAAGRVIAPATPADLADAAVGEGPWCRMTPWQVALMGARVAGRGRWRVTLPDGRVRSFTMQVDQKAMALIREGMRQSVIRGTSQPVAVPGLSIAGKTGTAHEAARADFTHAWFVGYAPADQPKVLVLVFLERGGHGYQAAALAKPIFKAAFKGIIAR